MRARVFLWLTVEALCPVVLAAPSLSSSSLPQRGAAPPSAAVEDVEELHDPVHLEWKNITTAIRHPHSVQVILDGVSGVAKPGRLLAILGPSGSGKTTLLNSLVGQLPKQRNIIHTGAVSANGVSQADWLRNGQPPGFVQQDDLFFPLLTVRETLRLVAELKLPSDMTPEEKHAQVDVVLRRLSLEKCADTWVGDTRVPGISGGERKRLSLALQLMGGSQVLLADEPTTGLDSAQAFSVVAALRQLAEEGNTIIASIHQPRSAIWSLMDDVMLMSEGRVLFSGPAEDALPYFESLGFSCPDHYNPAEFLIDLAVADWGAERRQEEEGGLSSVPSAVPPVPSGYFSERWAEEWERLQTQSLLNKGVGRML
eukprot:Cvel_15456.t1-p1 / transcript=Cvel_15456.t1 / gene=Cvel_15456 / organism=Chromera_velia_CCMP2878 / gene_product=ABC transporter G family member 7, putative / transcript_product=ABC transporter G family member 7, putative / location=Cvel_scaffold1144:52584-54181(+) / protein_length=368 / sequence_SO=supercontig / SO=protein_coding / is_pseudo=false